MNSANKFCHSLLRKNSNLVQVAAMESDLGTGGLQVAAKGGNFAAATMVPAGVPAGEKGNV